MKSLALKNIFVSLFVFAALFFGLLAHAVTPEPVVVSTEQDPQVHTASAVLTERVAPGDDLPITVRLLNFGGGKKVDATITYTIRDKNGGVVNLFSETIAVETTASYVKTIQILERTKPGIYTVNVSIDYQGQVVPANTTFSYRVERAYFGIFESDLLLYSVGAIVFGLFAGFLAYTIMNTYRRSRLKSFDYADVPYEKRLFYELISDTVLQMRQRVGDVALDIASRIHGLSIDPNTGRVLRITDDPAKIIALLVTGYEQILGKKVSFSLRKDWH